MIRDLDSSPRRMISQSGNVVYQYLRQSAAIESPPEFIPKFHNLLQNGRNESTGVSQAFENLVVADPKQFELFLSQCFYIILTCWLDRSGAIVYIDQLFDIFNVVGRSKSFDRRRQHLIRLIKNYQQSQSYQQLKLVVSIINPPEAIANNSSNSLATSQPIDNSQGAKTPLTGSYLIRYPYLYPYILPQKVEIPRLSEQIAELQNIRQKDFEIRLSKHIIYRFRLKQLAQMKLMTKSAGKMITKADNPSLISEKAFRIALKQYVGKLNNGSTLLERSQLFIAENKHRQNYSTFKQDLYHFIVRDIKPRNKTYQFRSLLEQKLANIFPQANEKPLNPTLILQTCRQLLSFLIVDPASNRNPAQFVELVANLGTAQVIMILIRIVLICPESKSDLTKKIYAIASHYQQNTVPKNSWLLKSLEHLLIAFSIYFGSVDVSIAKSVVGKI